jgi:16S rRNA (uracil1498-N3)-methyltransferase
VPARFYCTGQPRDGRLLLDPGESRHLARVCRLGVGDRVETFDGQGTITACEVVAVRSPSVELKVVGSPRMEAATTRPLTLATAVPKADRFDWLVEKATELGVARLIPTLFDRSVVEPGAGKLARLRRLIIETSKQCRRARLMALDQPTRWTALAGSFGDSMRFVADPEGCPTARWPPVPADLSLVVAVGPEGGLSPEEQHRAAREGWVAINLGAHTLRIETAGIAGAVALLAHGNQISTYAHDHTVH